LVKLAKLPSGHLREPPVPKPKPKKKPARVSEPLALYDAKTRLSELVDLASKGKEFVIGKSGKPMAKLVPYVDPAKRALRVPGKNVLGIELLPGWDDPITYEDLFGPDHAADEK
jgi:prevent-host-death family protein